MPLRQLSVLWPEIPMPDKPNDLPIDHISPVVVATKNTGSEAELFRIGSGQQLRHKAEMRFANLDNLSPEMIELMSPEDTRRMLHELHVHQIELQMQNEELLRSQFELDRVRARYFDLYDLAPVGYCTVGVTGLIMQVNLTATTMLGLPRSALVGKPISHFICKEDQDTYYLLRRKLSGAIQAPQTCQLRMQKFNETQFWISLSVTTKLDENKLPVIYLVLNDISESKKTELALQASKEHYRQLLEELQVGVVLHSPTTEVMLANKRATTLLKMSEDQLIGKSCFNINWNAVHHDGTFFVGDDYPVAKAASTLQAVRDVELGFFRPLSNDYSWLLMSANPILNKDGSVQQIICTFIDITGRKNTEKALQSSLQEKVALLNEVHHRVKNNLQIITSLLRLEAGRSTEPGTRSVLSDMQGRIRSMAVLHESLYRSGIFASVDLGAYLKQVATQAFRTLNIRQDAIALSLEMASISVSMDQATSCGLLVNEMISNCLKHAFPENDGGEVKITLWQLDETGKIGLRISDNGVGLATDFDLRCTQSLGLQLVSDLTQQLGGVMETSRGPGTSFTFKFDLQ
jgi:PAS domain S-box-containing protein